MAKTHKMLLKKLPDTGTQHLQGRNVLKRGSFYCGHVAAHGPGIAGGHSVFQLCYYVSMFPGLSV